jgi:integrase
MNSRTTRDECGGRRRFVADQRAAGVEGLDDQGPAHRPERGLRVRSPSHGCVGRTPVALLDRFERPSSDDQRPRRVLTAEELRRHLCGGNEPYRPIFEFAAESAARLGEVLQARVARGRRGGSHRDVHAPVEPGAASAAQTNRSRRCIEITPRLAAKLAAHSSGDLDYVFVRRADTPHDHRNRRRPRSRASGQTRPPRGDRARRRGASARAGGEVLQPAPAFHNLRHSHGSADRSAWDSGEVSAGSATPTPPRRSALTSTRTRPPVAASSRAAV